MTRETQNFNGYFARAIYAYDENNIVVSTKYTTGVKDETGRDKFSMFATSTNAFKYTTKPSMGFTITLRRFEGKRTYDNFEVQYPPTISSLYEIGQKKTTDRHGVRTHMRTTGMPDWWAVKVEYEQSATYI